MSALWDVLAVVRAWTYSAGASSSGGVAGRGQVEETRGWGPGGAWLGRRGAQTGRFYWGQGGYSHRWPPVQSFLNDQHHGWDRDRVSTTP
jgi:hypothetical protein